MAIARALANNPKVMLCDEAASALDTRTTVSILRPLRDINVELGVTMVMITHSLAVAQKVCNRIAVTDAGRIVEEGRCADVLAHPESPVIRELIARDSLGGSLGEAGAVPTAAAAAAGRGQVAWSWPRSSRSVRSSARAGHVGRHRHDGRVHAVRVSAMAGTVGTGDLGDIAARYDYPRYQDGVMIAVVILCIVLVQVCQGIGNIVARKIDKRS